MDDQIVTRVKTLFGAMMDNWDLLSDDKILRRTDITNIASQINNIVSHINGKLNGTYKTQPAFTNRPTRTNGADILLESLKNDLGGDFTIR